ncbi:MAG: pirin family protein [Xanthomonadales bacterium]|nr:pirin family protein [Xanthomonadales bacterium]NIN60395.1 pirin family protein [Xanthomonadales bacterium]NIN75748.1 pirin family protein [Xanthomonadales bacterium]NIO14310.1 pirin family protein [Xanthomonadales bacterium]NIP12788.1 pirin family protein [Xanthomonadales bacterium]
MQPSIIAPDIRDLGTFSVRRLLPGRGRRTVGPFIFWDHFGPVTLPPGTGVDVRPHPHIGLATVTYLFEGEIMHRDSLGCVQAIRPGAVNWMTAGRGIVHSERTADDKRAQAKRLHGLQIWLALPDEQEDAAPAFRHYPAGSLPLFEHEGVMMTLIAGNALGEASPVQVLSPLFYLEARLQAGQSFQLPDEYPERAVYVAQGAVTADGTPVDSYHMALFEPGGTPVIEAPEGARLAVLGGEPVGERHIWWNFVASTRERIRAAAEEWAGGGFERVPGDDEFIPLPDELPWQD